VANGNSGEMQRRKCFWKGVRRFRKPREPDQREKEKESALQTLKNTKKGGKRHER